MQISNLIISVLLGILQGLTEFLPVSSSGHLVLAKALMHIETNQDIAFEVFVHFGTFLSVLIIFRNDVIRILISLLEAAKHPLSVNQMYRRSGNFRLTVYIIIGCLPAGIVGLLFEHEVESFFTDPKLVSDMLLITGVILFLTRFARPPTDGNVSLIKSLGIGISQAIAIIPGISRAGSTISTALLMRISQENAAKFSFLMALPVIFGATLLEIRHLIDNFPRVNELIGILLGTMSACISGYFAIKFLLRVLRRGKFSLFSYYCFALGIIGLLLID